MRIKFDNIHRGTAANSFRSSTLVSLKVSVFGVSFTYFPATFLFCVNLSVTHSPVKSTFVVYIYPSSLSLCPSPYFNCSASFIVEAGETIKGKEEGKAKGETDKSRTIIQ